MSAWQEYRKQEKKLRSFMKDRRKVVEQVSRERAKQRRDPRRYLQVVGTKKKLYLDEANYRLQESQTNLQHWPADISVRMDLYDCRMQLDNYNEFTSSSPQTISREEQKQIDSENFERYRSLVFASQQRIGEEEWITQCEIDILVDAEQKKRRLAKAARRFPDSVGFSTANVGDLKDEDDDTETRMYEGFPLEVFYLKGLYWKTEGKDRRSEPDIDKRIEVEKELNEFGDEYGIADFIRLMTLDKKEFDEVERRKRLHRAQEARLRKLEEEEGKLTRQRRKQERSMIKRKMKSIEEMRKERTREDELLEMDMEEVQPPPKMKREGEEKHVSVVKLEVVKKKEEIIGEVPVLRVDDPPKKEKSLSIGEVDSYISQLRNRIRNVTDGSSSDEDKPLRENEEKEEKKEKKEKKERKVSPHRRSVTTEVKRKEDGYRSRRSENRSRKYSRREYSERRHRRRYSSSSSDRSERGRSWSRSPSSSSS